MKTLPYPIALLGCLLLTPLAPVLADGVNEIGIDRSNLTWQSEDVQEQTLQGIHALGATWFRDALPGPSAKDIAAFVNEVRLAKQNNLKILVNVIQRQADYDEGYQSPNASEDFKKRCARKPDRQKSSTHENRDAGTLVEIKVSAQKRQERRMACGLRPHYGVGAKV